jgi:two-component system LytT family sensor kinase
MSSRPLDQQSAEPAGTEVPLAGTRQGIVILGAWGSYSLFRLVLVGVAPGRGKSPLWMSAASIVAMGVFWALATPVVFAFARRLRRQELGWPRTLGLHAAAGLAFAAGVTLVRQGVMHGLDDQWPFTYWMPLLFSLDYHVITYAMLVIIGNALDGHRAYAESGRRAMALQTRLAEVRLHFLQRQLQPHFLFNALNTIAELARESPDAARCTLQDLARLLRAAVAHADDPEVSLREELATLEPFVQIQRVRFSDSLDIRYNVAPETLDACVPPLLLQPLVENAVRHGRAAHTGLRRVLISAQLDGDRLLIRVADSGPPGERQVVSISREKPGRGIGLRNTAERLAQLYGPDHTFVLRGERGRATVAELDLPFRTTARIKPSRSNELPQHSARNTMRPGRHGPEFRAPITTDAARLRASAPTMLPSRDTESSSSSSAPLSPRGWGGMILFWTAVGVWWLMQGWVGSSIESKELVPLSMMVIELVNAAVWLCLTPIVLWIARAVPLHRGRLGSALLVHTIAAITIGAIHVAVTLSIGVADRPLLIAGNIPFYTLDLFIYSALIAWWNVRDFSAWYHARATAAAQTEAMIARSRVEATALGLHAPFLLRVFEFTADLALVDAERTERVVERLADLLRAMLYTAADGARSVREELVLLRYCLAVHEALTGTPAELEDEVDGASLDAFTPPGAVNAVMEYILVRALAAPDQPLRIGARIDGPELVLHIEESGVAGTPAYDEAYHTPRSA